MLRSSAIISLGTRTYLPRWLRINDERVRECRNNFGEEGNNLRNLGSGQKRLRKEKYRIHENYDENVEETDFFYFPSSSVEIIDRRIIGNICWYFLPTDMKISLPNDIRTDMKINLLNDMKISLLNDMNISLRNDISISLPEGIP